MKLNLARKSIAYISLSLFIGLFITSFNRSQQSIWGKNLLDSLTEQQKRLSENALKGLSIYPELAISTFATEPMLMNPTNMDIDSKGRVWITEAYNYRPAISGNPTTPKGDRIVILTDTNGDGKADKSDVFYQSPELNAPLGIAVLDSMVIVSQSPYIWKMFDDNRDGKADRKEIMFQGIGGEQHDHGAHSFYFGPDGKLYFNMGNEGKQLLDAKGKPVLDQDGDPIDQKKYKQGMLFRCDLDGSHVEVLGHNFRNNFEAAVDSYGSLWQSDNDDDGNKGVRINAVLEHGNYGYVDEMNGEGWYVPRTNMETAIPFQHWHLNDPGVVPNLLQTGSGSPTGILIYEGNLLPPVFQNQMIHADAGPNVVRSYAVKPVGAGFEAQITNLVEGVRDQWFRPADVTVAPDGSIFIADWYDPGVGGHQAGDQTRGRIYRIAPKNHAYAVPVMHSPLDQLKSPNLATRYLGYQQLKKDPRVLEAAYQLETNPRIKARIFWLLAQGVDGLRFIQEASKHENPDFRMMAIRAMRRNPYMQWKSIAEELQNDKNPSVRRELAIALFHVSDPHADLVWSNLAKQYNGSDRWYLEAIGIGAAGNWDKRLGFYLSQSNEQTVGFKDIIWRSRTELANPFLFSYLKSTIPTAEKLRYFRALDFIPGNDKFVRLVDLINHELKDDIDLSLIALHHLSADYLQQNAVARQTILGLLPKTKPGEYIQLVEKYGLTEALEPLFNLILAGTEQSKAAKAIYNLPQGAAYIDSKFKKGPESVQVAIINAIRSVGNNASIALLFDAMKNPKNSQKIHRDAARGIGNTMKGEDFVLDLLKKKQVPKILIPSVVESVSRAWRKGIRLEANKYLTNAQANAKQKHPPLNDLLAQAGHAEKGVSVFVTQCAMCHQVNNEGINFGPSITEIGSKLSKDGLYLSILHPNAGIGFGYETYELISKKGDSYQGIIVSRNETDVMLKLPGGMTQNFKTSQLKSIKQLPNSMMPEGLAEGMKTQELVDLVEYLATLKKK